MYKCILIATDGSALSDKAVDSGLALAALCSASVVVMKVIPRYPTGYSEGALPTDAAEVHRVEAQWRDAAQALLDAIQAKGVSQGLQVQTVLVKSDLVAEGVIAAATEHACDLIVMASHGRKGVSRLLLGSETQNVLTHSHIPVLVLR